MGHKIAVRVRPFKRWSDVANATRHGRREDPAEHVDRDRTNLNLHWEFQTRSEGRTTLAKVDEPVDLEAAFKRLAASKGAKWRKNAIIGTEMLFLASPGFFDEAGPRDSPEYREKAKAWAMDCARATAKRYPGMTAAVRVDLDETTPHCSVFMLPMYEKSVAPRQRKDGTRAKKRPPKLTISHNTLFGGTGDEGPKKLSALQDWAAEAMQEAGHALERGEAKETKGPDHTTPAEGRRLIQKAKEEAERIVAVAKAEAAQTRAEAAQEATQANERAEKAENQNRAWQAHWTLVRDLLRKLLPAPLLDTFTREFREQWTAHPLNPDRPEPQQDHGDDHTPT